MFKQEYDELNQKMMNNKRNLNTNLMESEDSSEANVTDLMQELKDLRTEAEKEDLIRKQREQILEKEDKRNEIEDEDDEDESEKLKYEPINPIDEPPELLDISKEKKILKEKRNSLVNLKRRSSIRRVSNISSKSYYENLNNNVIYEFGVNTDEISLNLCVYPTEDSIIDEFGVYFYIYYYLNRYVIVQSLLQFVLILITCCLSQIYWK